MHWASIWESVADAVPDHPALIHGGRIVDFGTYERRASCIAQALQGLGLGIGDAIAICLWNCPEYAEAQFAALKNRQIVVNTNYRYTRAELTDLLGSSGAKVLLCHSSHVGIVSQLDRTKLPQLTTVIEVGDGGAAIDGALCYDDLVSMSAPAPRITRSPADPYVLYTGGTTGRPKGVVYPIGRHVEQFLMTTPSTFGFEAVKGPEDCARRAQGLLREGTSPTALPGVSLMHGTGDWGGLMGPHLFGGTSVLLTGKSFDASEMWDAIEACDVAVAVIAGDALALPLVRALAERAARGVPIHARSLRLVLSSGAIFSRQLKVELLQRFPRLQIVDAIGSTEGMMGMSVSTAERVAETGVFTPLPETKVLAEDGREVLAGSGEVGFLAVGSDAIPSEYRDDPTASGKAFRDVDGHRYSFPGDMATVQSDGSIKLLGRSSQVINSGGEKVFAEEVEMVLKSFPEIDDAVVVGVTHQRFGQVVGAVLTLRAAAVIDFDEIVKAAAEFIASYKLPRAFAVADDPPRTITGKPDYAKARHILTHGGAGVLMGGEKNRTVGVGWECCRKSL